MADIRPTTPIRVEDRFNDFEQFKFNPSALGYEGLSILRDISGGRVETLEPSNPLVYNIEVAALMTAFAVQEYVLNCRKMYPSLANNENDLYRHMSDKDYLGRFSTPARAPVEFRILLNDFLSKAYYDPVTKDRIIMLPRNLTVTVDSYIFSLTAPIIIRLTEDGVIDVRYDSSLVDDVFLLETGYIPHRVQSTNQEEKWIAFTVNLHEIFLESIEIPIEKFKTFRNTILFKTGRQFYHAKAFYTNGGDNWTEMISTHTEDVWDIQRPTCIFKVNKYNNQVEYFIPDAYVNNGLVGSRVKIVIYSTKGEINVNFVDFPIKEFKIEYNTIFPKLETNVLTAPVSITSKFAYIREKVIDGRNEKTFSQLKEDVINNNLRHHIPITDIQINNTLQGTSLEPIRNYDVVTGREYLVKTTIPSSVSKYSIARMSLDLMQFKTTLKDLNNSKNAIIPISDEISIIPQGTVFIIDPWDGLRVITKEEHDILTSLSGQSLIKEVNEKNYLSSFFHYILDASGLVTQLRPYEVNRPALVGSNFVDYNNTTRIGIETSFGQIQRVPTGYELRVQANFNAIDPQYDISNITPYLIATGDNGAKFFLQGRLYSNVANQTVFSFYIDSKLYIDRDDQIHIHNFLDSNGNKVVLQLNIEQDLDLIYTTDSYPNNFTSKNMDKLVTGSFLAGHRAVVTLETHTIRFAERLKRLYSRVHSSTGVGEYLRYEEDVPLKYTHTVYNVENKIVHRPGEVVLDEKGEIVYAFRKGDVVLDEKGQPEAIPSDDLVKYLNVLLLDYRFALANSDSINQYKEDVRVSLLTLLRNNMEKIQSELLDVTEAFLTVPNGLVNLQVEYNGITGNIKASQSFKFNIHVDQHIFENDQVRVAIQNSIREILDKYLAGNRYISKIELTSEIFRMNKEFIREVSLEKLTELDGEYMSLLDDNGEISIKKKLYITPEGYNVEDDITYNFISIKPKKVVRATV